jgi:hypothetical protein
MKISSQLHALAPLPLVKEPLLPIPLERTKKKWVEENCEHTQCLVPYPRDCFQRQFELVQRSSRIDFLVTVILNLYSTVNMNAFQNPNKTLNIKRFHFIILQCSVDMFNSESTVRIWI